MCVFDAARSPSFFSSIHPRFPSAFLPTLEANCPLCLLTACSLLSFVLCQIRNQSQFPLPYELSVRKHGETNFQGVQEIFFVPNEGTIVPGLYCCPLFLIFFLVSFLLPVVPLFSCHLFLFFVFLSPFSPPGYQLKENQRRRWKQKKKEGRKEEAENHNRDLKGGSLKKQLGRSWW